MLAAPPDTPVISPVLISAVAMVVLLLLHVPPVIVLLSVTIVPSQTVVVPVIGAVGFTVTVVVAVQPAAVIYTIEVVPADTPVTIPDDMPIVATPASPELHVPPAGASLSAVILPWQTVVFPVIADGSVFIVTVVVAMQPAVVVNLIITFPADAPYTIPATASTVAIAVLLLLQVPPVVASLNIVALPAHRVVLPVTGVIGFTVTVVVAKQPVGIV